MVQKEDEKQLMPIADLAGLQYLSLLVLLLVNDPGMSARLFNRAVTFVLSKLGMRHGAMSVRRHLPTCSLLVSSLT